MRSFRIGAVAAALLLTSAVLAGCAASPEVESVAPTPMFASDEEAFAAAEATYRAYVDAENRARVGDTVGLRPESFLVGEALDQDLAGRRALESSGQRLVGDFQVGSFQGDSNDTPKQIVSVLLCVDARAVRVLDGLGNDATPTARTSIVPLRAEFVRVDNELRIRSTTGFPSGHTCPE